MPVSKAKKEGVLNELKTIIKDAGSVVFINFHGLTTNETTGVRKELKSKGVEYTVAKKTLTRKALTEQKIPGDMPEFLGELGVVYGKDSIDPAREVYSFEKKLENKLSILGGIFEGKFMNKSEMTTIAQIPSLQTLHGQFVNLINSPIQGFVMALSEIAKGKTS